MVVDKCALPCPYFLWPQQKMNILLNIQVATNSFNLVLNILLLILFGILAREMTIRMEIIFSFILCSTICRISYLLAPYQEMTCTSDKGWMVQRDAMCGVDGAFFQFGSLEKMAIQISSNRMLDRQKLYLANHCFPFIFCKSSINIQTLTLTLALTLALALTQSYRYTKLSDQRRCCIIMSNK
ncbi:hypothetical protein SAMD00019534_078620 [Acytostelium subglobosum LB1]|uniref:hypothetical protein n=1 Tax=Acytostelium subglobosum LB1 TaxID=1410327 RepID=UPI000644E092|nr:hypothetical protein SAMD00019534_078620 [Acytostelium subglobosum LB1]GAM24687.1 hypothetical protein SAMD00019534_078620 [Acytostelium subglobosum LB1]|eukprot:XP_012752356.1 hypothetical protein SAMD00019534_078620 [Acytostelium subglobosum LB1]